MKTIPLALICTLPSLLFSLLWSTAIVAAELQVPEPFDVLVVNGEDFTSSLRSTKSVALKVGRNVIIIEYDQIFDAEFGDSHDRIRSAPFALVFDANADTVLTLTDPKLKTGAEAKRYIKSPIIQLRDQQNRDVAVQRVPVREMSGVLLADAPAAANITENSSAAASMPPQPRSTESTIATATSKTETTTSPDALQMLNFWWQQASQEQRAAFIKRVKN